MRANACASGFWARAITFGAGIPMSRAIHTRRLWRREVPQRNMRRGTGCSSLSPHASASSTARRCAGSAGNKRGSGCASSSAREMFSDPCTRRPSSFNPGTVPRAKPGQPQLQRMGAGKQVLDLVLDALALEHQARSLRGVRQRQGVELGGHGATLSRYPNGEGRPEPPLSDTTSAGWG